MQVNLDKWHHCVVDKKEFVKLLQKSDYQGFKHMFIFFGSLVFFGYLAYATWGTWWTVLFLFIYGGFNLGWSFHVKLLGATFILIASIIINIHLKKSAQNQTPPNQNIMKYCASAGRLGFLLALGGAIWTFA